MTGFRVKSLSTAITLSGLLVGMSTSAFASAFQLWETGLSDLGNYHSGTAAIANNATTAYSNPAGLVRLPHQQISLGAAEIVTNIKYKGSADINTLNPSFYNNITQQAGGSDTIPNFNYALPINRNVVLGFSIVVPLGLETQYSKSSMLRYAATDTTVQAIDFTPSIGVKITPKLSLGLGFDAQRLKAVFDQYGGETTQTDPYNNTELENHLYDWGFGWRAGLLYQFTPSTRIGLTYRAKIVHHAKGSSTFTGPLSLNPPSNVQRSNHVTSTLIMPATTILSFYQDLTPHWTWMASITYSQWGAFNTLTLWHAAGPGTTNLPIHVSQNFRNTWNLALGGIYRLNTKWQFTAGVGFDQTPVSTHYRTIQLPDNNRYAVAIGAHYQPVKAFGVDVGWLHFFLKRTRINRSTEVASEVVQTTGLIDTSADVLGLQLTYTFC